MSHFSCTVRVPSVTTEENLEDAVAEMMLPYKEYQCGDPDPPGIEKFLVFEDEEDKYRREYDEEGVEMVRVPDSGGLAFSWDERFRMPGTFGTGSGTHQVPADYPMVEVPYCVLYATFEEFCSDWHGQSSKDEKTGRYGYWHNPNKKWDWYQIGGRWEWKFPIGDFDVDRCRIRDLNWEVIDRKRGERIDKLLCQWETLMQSWRDGKDDPFGPFDGPRDEARMMGLLLCQDEDEITEPYHCRSKWPRQTTPGVDRYDVVPVEVTRELVELHAAVFSPIVPWAAVDSSGWRERGSMGWFGMSDTEPRSYVDFFEQYLQQIRLGDQDDWIVNLDCHI